MIKNIKISDFKNKEINFERMYIPKYGSSGKHWIDEWRTQYSKQYDDIPSGIRDFDKYIDDLYGKHSSRVHTDGN